MMKIDNTQIGLIGILVLQGNYIEKMTVTPEMLDYPFNTILKAMMESYKMYEQINLDYLAKKITPEEMMNLLEISTKVASYDYSEFVKYERIIHERKIEKELTNNVVLYKNGEISLMELKDRITIPNMKALEKLTEKDLIESIQVDQKNIDFVQFPKIRALLNLHETDLLVIAGTPGSGKSAMALNILEDLSRNYECTYINLEMSVPSLHKRLVSIKTRIDLSELSRFRFLHQERKDEILKSLKFIKDRNITLVNTSQTLQSIKELIAVKNKKHSIFIIDHIGLIKSKEKNPYQKTTEIIEELRSLALDYNTTIIALSQLNREASKEKKPTMSMLRDSGATEQSATQIMLLYSEETIDGLKYYVNIAKNREGQTGVVQISYNKKNQIISDNF